jgi:hypothetical protein
MRKESENRTQKFKISVIVQSVVITVDSSAKEKTSAFKKTVTAIFNRDQS